MIWVIRIKAPKFTKRYRLLNNSDTETLSLLTISKNVTLDQFFLELILDNLLKRNINSMLLKIAKISTTFNNNNLHLRLDGYNYNVT